MKPSKPPRSTPLRSRSADPRGSAVAKEIRTPGIQADAVSTAAAATRDLLRFSQPADTMLTDFFRNHKCGAQDRNFIAETAYAVVRRKRRLERIAEETNRVAPMPGTRTGADGLPETQPTPRQLVLLSLARIQGLSYRQIENALREGEREWLDAARTVEPEFSQAETLDFPDWLTERLAAQMSAEDLLALANSLNTPAPLDLRVNVLKTDRDTVIKEMITDGLNPVPCPYAPQGLRLKGRPSLHKNFLYLDGSVEVQDEGSQLLGYLLAPKRGEMVVDFCAGAGGKTLLLGAMMRSTGRLYAFDVAEKRLAKLKPRVARAGLSNVHTACLASENDIRVKRLHGKIDRVLVDAPCSGLGTLRRNPDLKWRQSPRSVEELTVKQAAILAAAARLPKPGGRLVYATCSILREENEAIVDAFLAAHPEYRRLSAKDILAEQGIVIDCGEDMHLTPQRHGTDGFYAAVLERSQ